MLPVAYSTQIIEEAKLEDVMRIMLMGVTHIVCEKDFELAMQRFNIIKLPKFYYQLMYDSANREDKNAAKKNILQILKGFFDEQLPNYNLIIFADFSTLEAKAIHPHMSWGMWIKILQKVNTRPIDLLDAMTKANSKSSVQIGYK